MVCKCPLTYALAGTFFQGAKCPYMPPPPTEIIIWDDSLSSEILNGVILEQELDNPLNLYGTFSRAGWLNPTWHCKVKRQHGS